MSAWVRASWPSALGALLLFVSNLLALVLAGTLVFTALGYTGIEQGPIGLRGRPTLTIAALLLVVGIPLVANTVGAVLIAMWQGRVETIASEWVSTVPGASVDSVDVVTRDVYIRVRTPTELPPVEGLMSALAGQIPSGVPIHVTTSLGSQIDAGEVGSG